MNAEFPRHHSSVGFRSKASSWWCHFALVQACKHSGCSTIKKNKVINKIEDFEVETFSKKAGT